MAYDADVLVVGSGPAGAVVAGLLAEYGHAVTVLDRARFPRPKPCGESVNPGAVDELLRLGALEDVLRLPHARIRGWRIQPVRGPAFEGEFPPGRFGLGIDRSVFDSALVEFARSRGARIVTGVRVQSVLRAGGGDHETCASDEESDGAVTGVLTADGRKIFARLVIGADGLRSVVVRRLGLLRRRPKLWKIALTAHVRGAVLPPGRGILQMTRWGCIGIAPVSDGTANVVVVLAGSDRERAAGSTSACFDALSARSTALLNATREGPVKATGPFDCPVRKLAGDGFLLVGDAAGYFDPLTGQGICRALRSARMAAEVANHCLLAGDLSRRALLPYERRCRRAFFMGAQVQHGIEAIVSRPMVLGAAANLLSTVPAIANGLVLLTGDVPRRNTSGESVIDGMSPVTTMDVQRPSP